MADNKECKNCGCECHCSGDLHNHHWDGDVCTCEQCNCAKSKAEDLTKDSTKFSWSITWGKIRSNKSGEED